jgi:hypothetical protein
MGDPVAHLNTEDRIMPATQNDLDQESLTTGAERLKVFVNAFDNMNRVHQVCAVVSLGAKPSFRASSDLRDISGVFRRSGTKAAESCIHGIAFALFDFDCAILALFNETAINLGCDRQVRDSHLPEGSRLGELFINHRVIQGIREAAIAAPLPVINEGRTDAPRRPATV